MRTLLGILVVLLCPALSGCGTLATQLDTWDGELGYGKPELYRGVQFDIECIRGLPALIPLLVPDVVLSAVFDTLLIPLELLRMEGLEPGVGWRR